MGIFSVFILAYDREIERFDFTFGTNVMFGRFSKFILSFCIIAIGPISFIVSIRKLFDEIIEDTNT